MLQNNYTESSTAHIALGSNLNDPFFQLKTGVSLIAEKFEILKKSLVYETTPIGGPLGQSQFLNAVILISLIDKKTGVRIKPHELLKTLQQIEDNMGRLRQIRWEARIIDLDILTYCDHILNEEILTIPHPRMMEREFVLAPFCDISPDWQHPISKQSAISSLEFVKGQGVKQTNLII